MEMVQNSGTNNSTKPGRHILICLIAAFPIWIISYQYLQTIDIRGEEETAFAITICSLVAIYLGRYVATVATLHQKRITTTTFIFLGGIIFLCMFFLFIAGHQMTNESKGFAPLFAWIIFFVMTITAGILIKLFFVSTGHQLQEARSTADLSQAELKLLQSQLSPHFLFNTLNNLYGLSLTQHEKIPPLLLKLSELLRYSVYDAKDILVPLSGEIEYIQNYIEFEKIRIGERLQITSIIEKVDPKFKIAPMLLIVFVENAFKHAKNSADETISIDISIKTWGKSILFAVRNSYDSTARKSVNFETHSGFGLDNVQKRLEVLYAGNYDLKIDDEEGIYTVLLQLKGL